MNMKEREMRRKPSPEAYEAIKRQRDLQQKLFEEQIHSEIGDYRLIDSIRTFGEGSSYRKEVQLPGGRKAVYQIVHEFQKDSSPDGAIKEIGEKVAIFDSKPDRPESELSEWRIELIELNHPSAGPQYYLLADYCGKTCWFWNTSGISSWQSDETANRLFIDACRLLENVRLLANP